MSPSKRNLLLLLSAWLAGNQPAQAAGNLNDYLMHGYHIASRTEVVGTFKGCDKDRSILMKDKSMFNCDRLVLHRAYAPTAFILATTDMPPKFVVLIDGQAYSGSLSRLSGKQFRHPAEVTTAIESATTEVSNDHPLFAAMPLVPITPTQPVFPTPDQQTERPRGKSYVGKSYIH